MQTRVTLSTEVAQTEPKPKVEVVRAGHSTRLTYRPDIDGLRAVAVGTVIAFHLQLSAFQGGFVGVDVFFVISGYLISSILLSDLHAGRFSLREFYVRRIRRILPALVAALLGTTALALVFSLPSELVDYARSLIAATLSASNLYFGLHSNYFDPRAFSRPALQTWSLGVEEQFYLFFPPLLCLLFRRARSRLNLLLVLLAAVSFAISCALALKQPESAYFMPYSRAWELLIGTLLALPLVPRLRSVVARNAAAVAGLLLILAAVRFYSVAVPFPGVAALPPCLGAALLIWSGQPAHDASQQPTGIARLLGLRPVVFVGAISYSLYLWHWPIVVFVGMGGLWGEGLPARVSKVISLAVMLMLATLSWRFVERPFREGRLRLTGRGAFVFAGVSAAVLVAVGVAALALKGLPQRFPARVIEIGSYLDEPMDYRMGTCLVVRRADYKPDVCLRQDGRPNWLLLGDSHAAAQWTGLQQALPTVNVLQATHSFCHPDPAQTGDDCGEFMQSFFNGYLATHHVDRILAVARWEAGDVAVVDRLVAWAAAHHTPLTLIGPTQDYDVALPRLLALSILRHDPALPYRHRVKASAEVDRTFAEADRARWHVPYISMVDMFCSPGACQTYTDAAQTIPLQFDTDHLTNEGSVLVARRMVAEHLLPPAPLLGRN